MSVATSTAAAIAEGRRIVAAVEAGAYLTAAAYEADANVLRASLAALIVEIDAAHALDGATLILALEEVAGRLIDLRALVVEGNATIEEALTRTSSLIELAVLRYEDMERWEDLAALNPRLPHPGFIPAGAVVVRHVR